MEIKSDEGRCDIWRRLINVFLSSALIAAAQGNDFDRVRYNGGTVESRVKPDDWRNKLTITSDRNHLEAARRSFRND